METNNDDPSKRSAIRVDASFCTDFRPVSGKDLENISHEINSHRTGDRLGIPQPSDSMPADLDNLKDFQDTPPAIMKMWIAIEHKLDSIMKLIVGDALKLENASSAVVKDISSTGIRFRCDEKVEEDVHLLIRLTPPAYPSFTVDVVGRVLQAEDTDEGEYIHPVEYTAIHPDDREFLITYIFKRQREILRGKRDD